MTKPCSRGRLLRIGGGRHANQHGYGSPIKQLHNSQRQNNDETNSSNDSSLDYDDGTLDPNLWADDWDDHAANSYVKKGIACHSGHLKEYDISDDDESDDGDQEELDCMPLVSDMIMRPYRVTQSIHAASVREGDLMDCVMGRRKDKEEVDVLLGNNKVRRLPASERSKRAIRTPRRGHHLMKCDSGERRK